MADIAPLELGGDEFFGGAAAAPERGRADG
jgi:hypothetical protein